MDSIKFGNEESKLFEEYAYNKNIKYVRKAIVICVFTFGVFSILDYYVYPELFKDFSIIRFGMVIPSFLLVYLFSYFKWFIKYNQFLISSAYFLGCLGIILMIYMIGEKNYHLHGLFLSFSIGFFLMKLKWKNSVIVFILAIIMFIGVGLVYKTLPIDDIVINSFFYISLGLIGIFGSYHIERYEKYEYINETGLIEKKVDLEKQIVDQLQEINESNETTIFSIAKLAESRDKFTGDHLERVGNLSLLLSKKIPDEIFLQNNLSKDQFLQSIRLASVLHDIGKISISDTILNKPSKLTEEEFEIMKTHSLVGAKTLMSIEKKSNHNIFIKLGIEIAKYHHERWDGTGYPTGIAGTGIPLSARIVSIMDVYDALISDRPYKVRFSKAKSIKIIEDGKGKHFDPIIADIFLDIARKSQNEELFWK